MKSAEDLLCPNIVPALALTNVAPPPSPCGNSLGDEVGAACLGAELAGQAQAVVVGEGHREGRRGGGSGLVAVDV